jgi:hypothetical protein
MGRTRQYPDVDEIFVRKARGRRERAALTFAEKLTILDQMRDDARSFREALESGRAKPVKPLNG